MSTLLDRLAEKLAEDAVEQARLANDPNLIDAVAKSLADTSTTFKDTFLTCVRYLQAEARARAVLPGVKADTAAMAIPLPGPDAGQPAAGAKAPPPPEPEPEPDVSEADEGYAEVDYLDEDEPAAAAPTFSSRPARAPGRDVEAETPAVEPEITGPRRRH